MFSFLTPIALSALALLAIPIVLHIFKPRKVRVVPFSSLRWLRDSKHRMSRKVRLHQVLLLLLRAGFITALVLALAVPILSSRATRSADRFIVLDVTPDMARPAPDHTTPLQRGKAIARRLVRSVTPGDRTALLRVGTHVRALGPLAADASASLNPLEASQVEPSAARLSDTLRLIPPLRQRQNPDKPIELTFITDNAAPKWSQGDIARFLHQTTAPVTVNVIDVAPQAADRAWIAQARLIDPGQAQPRLLRVRVGAAGRDAQVRTLRLSGLKGLPPKNQPLTIAPGAFVVAQFDLPPDYDTTGQVAQLDLLTPDTSAPADPQNSAWINLDPTAATRLLLIEPQLGPAEESQPGYYLRAALTTLDETTNSRIQIIRRTPTDVLDQSIAQADAIVLLDVPRLSEADLHALQQRVRQGAGLAVFLGPAVDPAFYNTQLHNPQRPADSLLPAALGQVMQERDFSRLTRLDADHPLFRGLTDPLYGDLDQTQFTACFQLKPDPALHDTQTLAYIGDTQPAILAHPFGAGQVLLFNTTADDAWTDLPRRSSYVPLVSHLMQQLTGGVQPAAFAVGAAAVVPLPPGMDNPTVEVLTPAGQRLTPAVQQVHGRPVLRLESVDQPGVYQVTARTADATRTFPFVVQADPSAGDATPIDPQTLKAWWSPAQVNLIHPDSPADPLPGVHSRWNLTPWLLALAALLFMAEMIFVHRRCPRAPRALAEGAIAQHGFFQPRPAPVIPEPDDSTPDLPSTAAAPT